MVWVVQLNEYALVWFPASWAPMVAERLFGWSSHPRGSSYPQRGQPASGLPRRTPECILGTKIVMALLVPVGNGGYCTEVVYKIRQWSLPGDAIVRCSTSAVESSGLNWMIKLSWTAILCYRRAFAVMCFLRSVQLRGRVLVGKAYSCLTLPERQQLSKFCRIQHLGRWRNIGVSVWYGLNDSDAFLLHAAYVPRRSRPLTARDTWTIGTTPILVQ